MTKDWHATLVSPSTPLLQAVETIDKSGLRVATVVDEAGKLCGLVTDGDVRRALIRHISMDAPVSSVMNKNPRTAGLDQSREEIVQLLKEHDLLHIPIIAPNGTLVRLFTLSDMMQVEARPNEVVLMAGGEGRRLRPLTENCPKPMLKVGDKPILETIITHFQRHGFTHFTLSLNYLGHQIRDYFGDGSTWGCRIRYVEETTPLGTAGALSLLPEVPEHPFFVMNGDILTLLNMASLLDFHTNQKAPLTLCVRSYKHMVPYGVAETEGSKLKSLQEKPSYQSLINAGIYVLEPSVLSLLTPSERMDMPDLIRIAMQQLGTPVVFPLREYWMDIGQMSDFDQAGQDFLRWQV